MIQNQQLYQVKEPLFHRNEVSIRAEALPGAQGNYFSWGNYFDSELQPRASTHLTGNQQNSAAVFLSGPRPAPPPKHICMRFTAPEEKYTYSVTAQIFVIKIKEDKHTWVIFRYMY